MDKKYYEDYKIGERFVTPGKTITDTIVTTMVGLAGFVAPFFLDEEYAKTTLFGTRIAPGRMTLFIMGGLEEQSGLWHLETAVLVGIDKVRFKAPLKPGDTIRVESEIIAMRETSKPETGVITHKSWCKNQRGEVVVEAESTHLVRRRG